MWSLANAAISASAASRGAPSGTAGARCRDVGWNHVTTAEEGHCGARMEVSVTWSHTCTILRHVRVGDGDSGSGCCADYPELQ